MLLPLVFGLVAFAAQDPSAAAPMPGEAPSSVAAEAGDVIGAQAEINLGLDAYRRRRFALAEEHFSRAVNADQSSAAAAYYLGYTIYKRVELRRNHPDKDRAKELFTKAFTLNPSFRPTWKRD